MSSRVCAVDVRDRRVTRVAGSPGPRPCWARRPVTDPGAVSTGSARGGPREAPRAGAPQDTGGWHMRALRVVGLDEDGESVICEDPDNAERFTVPAGGRLGAAARRHLTRLGQVQLELEAQSRPREIRTRIRAGPTARDVAESSGLPESRVERCAHPVLLERQQIAELAQRA